MINVFRENDSLAGLDDVVVTVGTMDGVHLGHTAIVDALVAISREKGIPSLVVTFDPHPRQVVHDDVVPLLTTVEERIALLNARDVDNVFILTFDQEVASLSPDKFIKDILVSKFGVRHVVVGYDHSFGRDREGNAAVLRSIGADYDFQVTEVQEQTVDGERISSTRIRHLISVEGNVSHAARLLGHPYGLRGEVTKGDGRGRTIGFPTANLRVATDKLIPANGVYLVSVTTGEDRHTGMLNIGVRPTFGELSLTIEVHILDFDADIYGTQIQVDFLKRLRDERKFDSVDDLVKQLSADRDRCIDAHRALI